MDKQIQRIERRKLLNWSARFTISLIIFGIFSYLVYLLFFTDIRDTSRDLVNILLGAFVGVLAKVSDYWFKEKEDPEITESKDIATQNIREQKQKTCPYPDCPSNKNTEEYSDNNVFEEPKY